MRLRVLQIAAAGLLGAVWNPQAGRAACIAAPLTVQGGSLAPFVADGARLEGRIGDCGDPARGDLLMFTHLGLKIPLLKIVIGVPGDRFGVRRNADSWNLLINGAVAANAEGVPYRLNKARADRIALYASGAGGIIPPNAWLAMGDNPAGTDDSSRFGLITREALRGIVTAPDAGPSGKGR